MKNRERELLFEKYDLDDTDKENLKKMSSLVRSISHLSREERQYCAVCNKKSTEKEHNSNHHVMKVEYLAVLVYAYDLWEIETRLSKRGHTMQDIISLKNYVDLYIPRVSLCTEHHTVFHELIGDNPILLSRKLELEETEKIIEIIEEMNAQVDEWVLKDGEDNVPEYKLAYKEIWDTTMTTSLDRLRRILETSSTIEHNNSEDILNDSIESVKELIEKIAGDILIGNEERTDTERTRLLIDCILADDYKDDEIEEEEA